MEQTPQLHALLSGPADEEGFLRLHLNESPYGPPAGVPEAVEAELRQWCSAYPDSGCVQPRAALANHFGVDPAMVAVGNGTDELVLLTALTFLRAGDTALLTDNTYLGHAMAAKAAGARISTVALDGYNVSAAALASRLADAVQLIFVCNPHNPTGTALSKADVEQLVDAAEAAGTVAVFDEAYIDFAGPAHDHALNAIRSGRRLALLRTFSKAWGLASLRAGYMIGSADLVERVWRTRQSLPFSMSRSAQRAVVAALADGDHLDLVRRRTDAARQRLYDRLDAAGIGYVPSVTNFVVVHTPSSSTPVVARLAAEHKVLVRDLTMFGLPRQLRVSVGTPEQVDQFCDSLQAVLRHPHESARPDPPGGGTAARPAVPAVPATPAAVFNGYVGATVIHALTELGLWHHLEDGACTVSELARRTSTSPRLLKAMIHTIALLGYVTSPVDQPGEEAKVQLTDAGVELARHLGYFTWCVGGYGDVLHALADLATGRRVFERDVFRDGAKIAAGSGFTGRTLMLPIEREVVAGLDFTFVADLGCGDASRLARWCAEVPGRRGLGFEVNDGALSTAVVRVADAGLTDRVEIRRGNVFDEVGRQTYPGVDLVSSFLMMHDLFNAADDPTQAMRSLRNMFPDARQYLVVDSVKQDWTQHEGSLPIFSVGFELVHAFMNTHLSTLETYESAFTGAGLRIERCIPFGAPSTYLWLLRA